MLQRMLVRKGSLSPMCVCGTGTEDNEHLFLHCPLYSILRQDHFDQLSDIDGFNVADVNPKELCPLLLFGDQIWVRLQTESYYRVSQKNCSTFD